MSLYDLYRDSGWKISPPGIAAVQLLVPVWVDQSLGAPYLLSSDQTDSGPEFELVAVMIW